MSTLYDKLGASVFFYLVGLFFSKVLKFVLRTVVGRSYLPWEYGEFFLGFSILYILTIISALGFDRVVPRWTAYFDGMDKKRGVLLTALKISIPFSVVLGGFLFFLAPFIQSLAGLTYFSYILRVLLVTLPFFTFNTILFSFFRGVGEIKTKILADLIIYSGLSLLLVALIVYMGASIVYVPFAYLITVLVVGGIAITVFFRKFSGNFSNFDSKKLLLFSMPFFLNYLVMSSVEFVGMISLTIFASSHIIGLYSAGFTISSTVFFILHGFRFMMLPKLSDLVSRSSLEEAKDLFKNFVKWVYYLSLPFLIMVFLFSKNIIEVFFGTEYAGGSFAMVIMAFGLVIGVTTSPVNSLMVALGWKKVLLKISLIFFFSNVVSTLFLSFLFGLEGAAIGLLLGFTVYMLTSVIVVKKKLEIFMLDLKMLKYFLVNLFVLVVTYLAKTYFGVNIFFLGLYLIFVYLSSLLLGILTGVIELENVYSFFNDVLNSFSLNNQ